MPKAWLLALTGIPLAAPFVLPAAPGRVGLRQALHSPAANPLLKIPVAQPAANPLLHRRAIAHTPRPSRCAVAATMKAIAPGNPDDLPKSPSGINSLSNTLQAATVAAVSVALAAGTRLFVQRLPVASVGWGSSLLGSFYAFIGVTHFTGHKECCQIYPGRGAWGFWYLPGSASFHVNWTGIVEIVGGLALAVSSLGLGPEWVVRKAAQALFALTVAVSPANTYMFTHGVLPAKADPLPVGFHAFRLVLQCYFLASFWVLGQM